MALLVSPAEPPALRAIGIVHSLCEARGADYLIPAAGRILAVQRKTVDDLLASLADGRMERELAVLRHQTSALILEGRPEWSADGLMIHRRRFTRRQWRGALFSIQWVFGVAVLETDSTQDTAGLLQDLEHWFGKSQHLSLERRPTANQISSWGRASDADWSRHLLQSFPGVGVVLADAIHDRFGRAPLQWSVSRQELGEVDGIGPKRLQALWDALNG